MNSFQCAFRVPRISLFQQIAHSGVMKVRCSINGFRLCEMVCLPTSLTYSAPSITLSGSRKAIVMPGAKPYANSSETSSMTGIGHTRPLVRQESAKRRKPSVEIQLLRRRVVVQKDSTKANAGIQLSVRRRVLVRHSGQSALRHTGSSIDPACGCAFERWLSLVHPTREA